MADRDQALINLASALDVVSRTPDAFTLEQLRTMAAEAGVEIPRTSKVQTIEAIRSALKAISSAAVEEAAAAEPPPAEPPPSTPPPLEPVRADPPPAADPRMAPAKSRASDALADAEERLRTASADLQRLGRDPVQAMHPRTVIDVPSRARSTAREVPRGGIRVAQGSHAIAETGAMVASTPQSAYRASQRPSWTHQSRTPTEALQRVGGRTVIVGSTPSRAPSLPAGVARPARVAQRAQDPERVANVAREATTTTSDPKGPAALTGVAMRARDAIATAVQNWGSTAARTLPADAPDRAELLGEIAAIGAAANRVAARFNP